MRMIFVNLPVTDLERAKAFHVALGHGLNPQFADDSAAMVVISEAISVMLLTHERFKTFITGEMADPQKATGVLLCLSADSREEVVATKARALAAGGREWRPTEDHGWMMGASFQDPDGHVWEVAWMDPAAAAGAPPPDAPQPQA